MKKFICKEIKATDRHTEPRGAMNQEEMTIELKLVSSGNASNIPTSMIVGRIMELLENEGNHINPLKK